MDNEYWVLLLFVEYFKYGLNTYTLSAFTYKLCKILKAGFLFVTIFLHYDIPPHVKDLRSWARPLDFHSSFTVNAQVQVLNLL